VALEQHLDFVGLHQEDTAVPRCLAVAPFLDIDVAIVLLRGAPLEVQVTVAERFLRSNVSRTEVHREVLLVFNPLRLALVGVLPPVKRRLVSVPENCRI